MTTTSTGDSPPVPAAPIVDSLSDTTDSLSALFEHLNISGPTAVALTVALRGFIQDTVVATVRKVTVDAGVSVSSAPIETYGIDDPATATPPVDATTAIPPVDATTAIPPVDATTATPPVDATIAIPPVYATTATPPVDANTATLPVGIGGVAAGLPAVYTRLYGGITYDVPAPNASGPYYWVTRGRRVGIFSTWQRTSSHVIGVSRASFSKVRSIAEGVQLMENAIDSGETEWLV
ncbi:hypothetical protein DEU56DRAFT_910593 [Suillus clintonianus]|uniref:uncharacterized protein n=1 Tax=Suillus clintonianus TaxID=1904413 RepID=UPI001B869DF7|nr:uncharacterized protein DEU56DRAFT_910593 [Suillus clintonianus]KAG2144237.1 hypothetical protein DEU56DRAFT_910593 [Suillus clintonianus]